eukprot:8381008-Pyramimonas_sp.AAC.1
MQMIKNLLMRSSNVSSDDEEDCSDTPQGSLACDEKSRTNTECQKRKMDSRNTDQPPTHENSHLEEKQGVRRLGKRWDRQ